MSRRAMRNALLAMLVIGACTDLLTIWQAVRAM